jgi:hypothetical protein
MNLTASTSIAKTMTAAQSPSSLPAANQADPAPPLSSRRRIYKTGTASALHPNRYAKMDSSSSNNRKKEPNLNPFLESDNSESKLNNVNSSIDNRVRSTDAGIDYNYLTLLVNFLAEKLVELNEALMMRNEAAKKIKQVSDLIHICIYIYMYNGLYTTFLY